MTQPRRISALGVSDRVASERCEPTEKSLSSHCVRLSSNVHQDTRLTFCTPAVLLNKLQSSPDLSEYTHVLIDEVHEREVFTDFILIALKEMAARNCKIKIVLMSATLNTDVLTDYFMDVGVVEVSGERGEQWGHLG